MKCFLKLAIGLVIVAVLTAATMLLWNNLLPDLLGVKTVSYWQALGLMVLGRLLFGCGRGLGGPPGFMWRWRLRKKLANMTPEERQKFMASMSWCGGPAASGAHPGQPPTA